ncbi:hypothetical protein MRX96_044208 [Rhipicephalus microplus]
MDGVGGEHLAEEQGGSFARMLRYLAAAPPPRSSGRAREVGIPRRVPAGSLARAGDVAGCWAAPVVELVRRAGRLSDQCWMP